MASIGEEEIICSICLEAVEERSVTDGYCRLPCDHRFHIECIVAAFSVKGRKECPNCRHDSGSWLLGNLPMSSEEDLLVRGDQVNWEPQEVAQEQRADIEEEEQELAEWQRQMQAVIEPLTLMRIEMDITQATVVGPAATGHGVADEAQVEDPENRQLQ